MSKTLTTFIGVTCLAFYAASASAQSVMNHDAMGTSQSASASMENDKSMTKKNDEMMKNDTMKKDEMGSSSMGNDSK